MKYQPKRAVVIGAGIGGLTTGALLAKAGLDVTVLEAHIYPGGCAGTFYHQKYRFDAGATLAGGFHAGGPMDIVAQAVGIDRWPTCASEPAMTVHLPDGARIDRRGDELRWDVRQNAFDRSDTRFWTWQEQTADLLWDLALRVPPWPPQTLKESTQLARVGMGWLWENISRVHPSLALDLNGYVKRHLNGLSERLRLFVDAQLLIASQATSDRTNALYGAAALDLPRRGVVHVSNGIGGIAETIAGALQNNGGTLHYRQQVEEIMREGGRPVAVRTKRGQYFDADIVVANLPPWNLRSLIAAPVPVRIASLPAAPRRGGGAFMCYVGIDDSIVPADGALHHQVVLGEPLGEGNSVFLSLSPSWDSERAPEGQRALTISTHTRLDPWWLLFEQNRDEYERRKEIYTDKLIAAAERALPGLRQGIRLVKPGTPVTFQRFTRRHAGWVGGFPQSSLFTAWGPSVAPGIWMVGDTIFPGQSIAAVALGGLRVANSILQSVGADEHVIDRYRLSAPA